MPALVLLYECEVDARRSIHSVLDPTEVAFTLWIKRLGVMLDEAHTDRLAYQVSCQQRAGKNAGADRGAYGDATPETTTG